MTLGQTPNTKVGISNESKIMYSRRVTSVVYSAFVLPVKAIGTDRYGL